MLSRAGLDRLYPRATLLLLLASNVPDADIVTRLGGSLLYLDYHRHLTHALVAVPLMALPCVLMMRAVERRAREFPWMRALLVSVIGVLVHLTLDLWNNYGVRLLLPFSSDWFSLDAVMVIDPWIWLVLGLAIAAPALARLVGSEIASTNQKTRGRGWAVFALLFVLVWVGGRMILHNRAVEILKARNYQGEAPLRVAAWPTPFNPLRWVGYVSTESAWSLHDVRIGKGFDPEAGRVYHKPSDAARINAAKRTDEVRRFLQFARYPVWRLVPVTEPDGGVAVEGVDVRFGRPEERRFIVQVVLDKELRVVSSRFEFGNLAREGQDD